MQQNRVSRNKPADKKSQFLINFKSNFKENGRNFRRKHIKSIILESANIY